MCGGKNELWYFTPAELDLECNETVLTQRFYAWNSQSHDAPLNVTVVVAVTFVVMIANRAAFVKLF